MKWKKLSNNKRFHWLVEYPVSGNIFLSTEMPYHVISADENLKSENMLDDEVCVFLIKIIPAHQRPYVIHFSSSKLTLCSICKFNFCTVNEVSCMWKSNQTFVLHLHAQKWRRTSRIMRFAKATMNWMFETIPAHFLFKFHTHSRKIGAASCKIKWTGRHICVWALGSCDVATNSNLLQTIEK